MLAKKLGVNATKKFTLIEELGLEKLQMPQNILILVLIPYK